MPKKPVRAQWEPLCVGCAGTTSGAQQSILAMMSIAHLHINCDSAQGLLCGPGFSTEPEKERECLNLYKCSPSNIYFLTPKCFFPEAVLCSWHDVSQTCQTKSMRHYPEPQQTLNVWTLAEFLFSSSLCIVFLLGWSYVAIQQEKGCIIKVEKGVHGLKTCFESRILPGICVWFHLP